MKKALGEGKEDNGGKVYAGWEPTLSFIAITSQMGLGETSGMGIGGMVASKCSIKPAISEFPEQKGSQTRLNAQIVRFIKSRKKDTGKEMNEVG